MASASSHTHRLFSEFGPVVCLLTTTFAPHYLHSAMGAESIVILGDSRVGKTALTVQVSAFCCLRIRPLIRNSGLLAISLKTTSPQLRTQYMKKLLLDSKETLSLYVLDTGGDPDYRRLRPQWIRAGRAFIIVFSAASRESFASVPLFAEMIRQHHRAACPLALVATKSDLPIKVSMEEGQACAAQLQARYFHLSVKNRTEVGQPFEYLARCLARPESPASQPSVANPNSGQTFATRTGAWTWAWAWAAQHQRIFTWTKSTFGSCIRAR